MKSYAEDDRKWGGFREPNVCWEPFRFNSTAEYTAEGPTGQHQERREMRKGS